MLILKIGGGAAINLPGIARDLANISQPCTIVQGANAARDALAERLGIEKRIVTSVSGYSSVYSDDATIDLMMLTYAGLRNKLLVQELQLAGVNAVGLSGLDGRAIQGRRNAGIRVRENGRTLLLRDRSGKPVSINRHLLDLLLESGYLPVLTMPIVDEAGFAINSENDDVVVALQRAYGVETIVHLIEAPGLLGDPADAASLVTALDTSALAEWEERAAPRMKRKLRAIRILFAEKPPARVIIADGRGETPVADALGGAGTIITAATAEVRHG